MVVIIAFKCLIYSCLLYLSFFLFPFYVLYICISIVFFISVWSQFYWTLSYLFSYVFLVPCVLLVFFFPLAPWAKLICFLTNILMASNFPRRAALAMTCEFLHVVFSLLFGFLGVLLTIQHSKWFHLFPLLLIFKVMVF